MHLIKINNHQFEPFVHCNDILVVMKNAKAINNDIIIAEFEGEILIAHFYKRLFEGKFFIVATYGSSSGETEKLCDEESIFKERVKILGVVKDKFNKEAMLDFFKTHQNDGNLKFTENS